MATSFPAFCTLCSNSDLATARVLANSIRMFHPHAKFFVCLADRKLPDTAFYDGPFELLEAREIGVPDLPTLAFACEEAELKEALKPFLLDYLLGEVGHRQLFYLDPTIVLFRPLNGLVEMLDTKASLLLTPYLHGPEEGEANTSDFNAILTSAYNLSFLGLRRCPESATILGWWKRRLLQHVMDPSPRDALLHHKLMDMAPSFAPALLIINDPGCNTGYWNLFQLHLNGSPDTNVTISGYPLSFFNFAGYDLKRPDWLGPYCPVAMGTPLRQLLDWYSIQLTSVGARHVPAGLYSYARFTSGTVIHPLVRRMFREVIRAWPGDPFETFEPYLHEAVPLGSRDRSGEVLTRFLLFLWRRLERLHSRYDKDISSHLTALLQWYVRDARREYGFDWRLIEPVAGRLGHRLRLGQLAAPPSDPGRTDISVVGYLRTTSGVGNVCRHTLTALAGSGLRVEGLDTDLNVVSDRSAAEVEALLSERASGRVHIFANVNADQLPQVLAHLAPRLERPAYRISIPAWELEDFPDPWLHAFDDIDEIWAQTPWIQRMLVSKLDKPVINMPVYLATEAPPTRPRSRFGLPKDTFLFYLAFDFLSFIKRKNPEAAVEALRRMPRPPLGGRVGLVIKTMNGAQAPEALARFRSVVGDDPDIFVIDEVLTRADTLALTMACDCVVSLHRCEGLGLVVAEAMALGRPVIATDYAATAELLTPQTGFPVNYRLVPVEPDDYPMAGGQSWAEPDIDHAAWLMALVIRCPDEAARRSRSAQVRLEARHGRDAVLTCQLNRLRQIGVVP